MNENNTPPEDGKLQDQWITRKKIVKGILIASAVIVVLYLLTKSMDPASLVDRWFGKGNNELPSQGLVFYPVDEDINIFEDKEYAQYDRRLYYTDVDAGITYSVEEEDLAMSDPAIRFFHEYFQTIIHGNEEEYALLFGPEYEAELPESFTMQMVYDIRIEPYVREGMEENCFLVEYKIHRNNGTFRDDIGSDSARAQLYELMPMGDSFLIKCISAYTIY